MSPPPPAQAHPPTAPAPPAVLVGALAFAALAPLVAPGLTWLDAGELGAAARELGIAHPPGFPAFALLHHAVMLVVPVGDAAFRGNLASALLVGVAAALIAAAGRALGLGRWAAAWALAAAGSAPLVLHGTTIEVYSGAAAVTAGLVLLWARWRRSRDARALAGGGLLAGLSLGHHAELWLFFAAAVVALAARSLRHRHERPAARPLIAAALFGLLGATVVLYLPLRAAAGPWRNWGDPSSLSGLWAHLSGARIRAAYADRLGGFAVDDLWIYVDQLLTGAPALLALGLPGLALLSRRPGGALVAALFVVEVFYAVGINPMGLGDHQNGAPAIALLALGGAATVAWLAGAGASATGAARRWRRPAAVGITAGAVLLSWAAGHSAAGDPARGLPRLLDAATDEAPIESLAFVLSDDQAAGWAFAQGVEGARPDVALIVRQHAWDRSSVGPVAARLPDALAGWSPAGGLASLQRLRDGWPVRWEWGDGGDAAHRPATLGPRWPWFAPDSPDDGTFEDRLRGALAAGDSRLLDSRDGRRAYSGLAHQLGLWRSQTPGRGALRAFELATAIAPEIAARWTNLGAALAALGDHAAALRATDEAIARDPGDRTARINRARYLLSLGQPERAEDDVRWLLAKEGADPAGLALRGIIRGNRGDLEGAAADFAAALRGDPSQPEALAGAAQLEKARAGRPAP